MLSAPYVFIIPQLCLHILQGREWIHFVYLNDNAAETLFAKYLYLTNVFGIVTVYIWKGPIITCLSEVITKATL